MKTMKDFEEMVKTSMSPIEFWWLKITVRPYAWIRKVLWKLFKFE